MKQILFIIIALVMFASSAFAANSNVVYVDWTQGVNAGATLAYIQAYAATTQTVSSIYACDSSGAPITIGIGAAGSEVALFQVPVSACALFTVNPYVVAGTRIAMKSAGTTGAGIPSSGHTVLSLLP
jgi:hypothetical protein